MRSRYPNKQASCCSFVDPAACLTAPGDPEALRQQMLRTVLRQWRAGVDPVSAGLPTRARRRPGLTCEDVAELAGLSVRWYMLFESASTKHRYSPRAVDRIAGALRIGNRDRALLHVMASPEAFHSVRLLLEAQHQQHVVVSAA